MLASRAENGGSNFQAYIPGSRRDSETAGLSRLASDQTASLVYWTALLTIGVCVLTLLILAVSSTDAVELMLTFTIGMSAVCVAVLLAVRSGRPLAGARLVVFGTIAMGSWFMFNSGGVESPAIAGMMIPIAMAGVLLGHRDGLIAAAVVVLVGFMLVEFEAIGVIRPIASIAWDTPSVHAIFIAADTVAVLALVFRGVLLRERAVQSAREANEGLSLAGKVYETTSEGIVVTTPDGSIVQVNDALLRMHGFERADVIGQNPRPSSSFPGSSGRVPASPEPLPTICFERPRLPEVSTRSRPIW